MNSEVQGDLPPRLLELLKDRQAVLPSGERVPMHSNVSPDEAETLYRAVREIKPEASIEIGFGQGISAAAILQALDHNDAGQHMAIDPFQTKYQNAGLGMIRYCGLEDRFQFREAFPEELIPSLKTPVQFGFIDGSHLFDISVMDFILLDKLLVIGGVVGFHDLWMPSLQKLVRYILANRAYEIYGSVAPPPKGWKDYVRSILRRVPRSERLFQPELLRPWSSFGLGNLVLLRKKADDQREWTYHATF
jgi:predicted O-methyltransferase YrrM